MPSISTILSAVDSAYTGGADRVNWTTELKPILDNVVGELLLRGVKSVANTDALSAVSGSDFKLVIVTAVGIFAWQNTGTVNGVTIFAAAGGGVWVLNLAVGGGSGGYEKETINLTGVSNYTLNWTSDRLAAYGKWPDIAVWLDHGSGVWRTGLVEFESDDPVEPTSFYVDFGGAVNAKIIIG